MQLVSLENHKREKLAATVRALLDMVESGEVSGVAWVAKFGPFDHRAGAAGDYGRSPTEALSATFMMERKLARRSGFEESQ